MGNARAKCWICGGDATTGEHLIKRSDLKQIFGEPQIGAPLFLHNVNKTNLKVQGLNSKALKLEKSLCSKCNNQVTQPYDRAWEQLSAFIAEHKDRLRPQSIIRADRVYATHSNLMMRYVQLYFVKLFGCLIVSNVIDFDLSSFARSLQSRKFHPDVFLKFGCVPRSEQIVGVAGLSTAIENRSGVIAGAQWFYELEGIAVNVIYSPVPGLWTDTDGSWHPARKKGRIVLHDFAPLLKATKEPTH